MTPSASDRAARIRHVVADYLARESAGAPSTVDELATASFIERVIGDAREFDFPIAEEKFLVEREGTVEIGR